MIFINFGHANWLDHQTSARLVLNFKLDTHFLGILGRFSSTLVTQMDKTQHSNCGITESTLEINGDTRRI